MTRKEKERKEQKSDYLIEHLIKTKSCEILTASFDR